MRRLVGFALSSCLLASPDLSGDWLGPARDRFAFAARLAQEEMWVPKRAEEVHVQLLEEALESKDQDYLGRVGMSALASVHRGLFRADRLESYVPRVGSDLARLFKEEVALASMGSAERHELFRKVVSGNPDGGVLTVVGGVKMYLGWFDVARRVLLGDTPELLALVSDRLDNETKEERSRDVVGDRERLRRVLLPVARARVSKDSVAAYLNLLEARLRAPVLTPYQRSERDELAGEVVLALLRAGATEGGARLESIAVEESRRLVSGGTSKPRSEDEGTFRLLVKGVRVLRNPGFEASQWRLWYPESPSAIQERLEKERASSRGDRRGDWLAPRGQGR